MFHHFLASELDYDIAFKQFLLLIDKTESEKRTIKQCKAKNSFKNTFVVSKQIVVYTIALATPTKLYCSDLELLTFPPSQIIHTEFLTWLCIVKF